MPGPFFMGNALGLGCARAERVQSQTQFFEIAATGLPSECEVGGLRLTCMSRDA
jgi:hypothetical protein